MNYLLTGTAQHLKPRREEPMKRSRGVPMEAGAGMSIATRTRRHSMPSVRAALSGRRRTGGQPGRDNRVSAGSGVSPIASGASRGVAIFFSR